MNSGEEFITLDVMTDTTTEHGDRERKLCFLIVARRDLLQALEVVVPRR